MKRAIVLAGGGAKGSYQMGFWRAIRELGIDFQIVAGTSVGALNASLMASGKFDEAMDMWMSITTPDIINTSPTRLSQIIDTKALAASLKGLVGDVGENAVNLKMDPFPLSLLIGRLFSEKDIRESGIELGIMTTEYPILRSAPFIAKDIPFGSLKDYLLASATVYPSMDPKVIGDKKYIDGGYSDILPINLALDMGAEDIIAVELNDSGIMVKYQTNYPVRTIKPHFDLGPSMVFNPDTAKYNMILGYNDTMRSFGVYDGNCYTFSKGEKEKFQSVYKDAFLSKLADVESIKKSETENFYKTSVVRLFSDIRKLRFGKMRYDLIMSAAETAAEIYEVSPCPIYESGKFNQTIINAFSQYEKSGIETAKNILENQKTLTGRLAALKALNKKDLTAFIAYKWLANERFFDRDMRAMGRTFPEEYFAALYISLIKGAENR